jgi:hypothetical protein
MSICVCSSPRVRKRQEFKEFETRSQEPESRSQEASQQRSSDSRIVRRLPMRVNIRG